MSGLRELVRFELTVAGTPATGTVTVDEGPPTTVPLDSGVVAWIMYRMFEPTWFDTITTGS